MYENLWSANKKKIRWCLQNGR